jgi:hypothetical protein
MSNITIGWSPTEKTHPKDMNKNAVSKQTLLMHKILIKLLCFSASAKDTDLLGLYWDCACYSRVMIRAMVFNATFKLFQFYDCGQFY